MGETTTSDAVPFLESSLGGSANGGRGEERSSKVRRWMQRVVDVEEAKQQLLFSLPMTLCNVFYYCITLASVMFAGHLGELELAGATLANSWATVTGFAFMVDSLSLLYFRPQFLLFVHSKSLSECRSLNFRSN